LIVMVESISAQGVIFNFSQDKSTYFWEDSVWIDNSISDKIHLYLTNHSTATLIKKSLFVESNDRWQKGANTRLALTWNQKKDFSWGVTALNNYSRLEKRRVTINRLGLHQNLKLSRHIRLNSLFSYSEASRHQSDAKDIDQGMLQKLDASFSNRVSGWGNINIAYNHELNLLERTPEKSFGLGIGFDNHNPNKRISFGYAGNYRKNKFFSELKTFDQITTQNKYEHQGDLQIRYSPLKNLELNLLSNYSYRRFEYRQAQNQFTSGLLGRDNLTSTFYYRLGAKYPLFNRSLIEVDYIYRKTDEDFSDLFIGQKINLGEFRMAYMLRLNGKDSIYINSTFSSTSFIGKDPSTLFSDRDKVYRQGQMVYTHHFSEYFFTRMRGSYQYIHSINISGELSANNNHNLLYLAQPELIWKPDNKLSISQSFVMYANYIYYDYEKYGDSPRNTIYRKASYQISADYRFSPTLRLLMTYRFRYEDFGQLIYRDQWAERISWERKGHLPSMELEWKPWNNLTINPGYSFERKHSFDHLAGENEGERILNEKELFKRQKIFINIMYWSSEKGSVEIAYTRRVQESIQFSDENSDILAINIRRLF
jgi:hypothetical protein